MDSFPNAFCKTTPCLRMTLTNQFVIMNFECRSWAWKLQYAVHLVPFFTEKPALLRRFRGANTESLIVRGIFTTEAACPYRGTR